MDSIAVYDGANDESHRIISAVVPHGDKEKWLEMAAKLRTMHAARVMLAASFASVLLYPLQQRPFILHLWANSRSGKTAVLKAAISIYGDPNVLLRSYNSTAVGIERTAAIMQNIPLALDELQSLSMKYENLARMTYMLGNQLGVTYDYTLQESDMLIFRIWTTVHILRCISAFCMIPHDESSSTSLLFLHALSIRFDYIKERIK